MNERVKYEVKNNVAYVTLTRADKYNALDHTMFKGLVGAAKKASKDKSLRAVIISGEGKAFCSGLDFPSFTKQPAKVLTSFFKIPGPKTNLFQEVAWCWRNVPIPVISVIHGFCYGGGVQIALGCDFRFITPDCEFSILEAKWGMIPDMSGTVTLRELIPIDQAKLLTMTGRVIKGTDAFTMHLVTGVSDNPMKMAEELVEELKLRSPDSVSATKRLFHKNWASSIREAFSNERMIQLGILIGKNRKIAMNANFKKEKPDFLPRK
jgi:enoyl-CoA hydratase/carnithine racemase